MYQGKVALYHSLKLIADKSYASPFELQLDSTDDFAIYFENKLVSAHQVKAKSSVYRSSYSEALEKSALIVGDKNKDISRYFHVATKLNDFTDYCDTNNITVTFYKYGANQYCSLSEIEPITKEYFKKISASNGVTLSENEIEYLYCKLSGAITRKVISIHSINQITGVSVAETAYSNRISSDEFLKIISVVGQESEIKIKIAKIRKLFSESLEIYVYQNEAHYTPEEITRLKLMFEHIFNLEDDDLAKFCYSIQPSESTLQYQNVEVYSDLICEFIKAPILRDLPHYVDTKGDFYLPTAISLPSAKRTASFLTHLRQAISANDKLALLLYEYKNLIGDVGVVIPVNHSITSPGQDLKFDGFNKNHGQKITRQLDVNIIPKGEAEQKIL